MVRYKSDFSATLDINPQDKLNSAISAHAIQKVAIFSLLPEVKEIINKNGQSVKKISSTHVSCDVLLIGNPSVQLVA